MSSSATDDGDRTEERKENPVTPPAEGWADQAPVEAVSQAEPAPQGELIDPSLWIEPQVASKAILTELFRSGGKTIEELQWVLSNHQTSLGWVTYWASQEFLTESQVNGSQRFQLSSKAVMQLELE